MHRIHSGFTVAAPIKNGESGSLRDLLVHLNSDLKNANRSLINFIDSETTLFVSGVILRSQHYNAETPLPETFVFATTFCGNLDDHLEELIIKSKRGLYEIFKHCIGFPKKDESLKNYLKAHSYGCAHNSRYNCITKKDVEREKDLRDEVEEYIDKAQKLNAFDFLPALQVKELIQRHIKTRGEKYEWANQCDRKNLLEICATKRFHILIITGLLFLVIVFTFLLAYFTNITFLFTIFIAVFLTVILIMFARLVIYLLRVYITRKTHPKPVRPSDSHIKEIAATQLHPVLNEMAAAAPLKEGRLRRHFYATALRVINIGNYHLMNIPTVSSLRWLVIDNKKRLIFLSNYTNTTDFYVRDFLNSKATQKGINFMFSNGMGFPDARLLTNGGIADNPEGYMDAVHFGQLVTNMWYAHAPNLTAEIINKNREIRNGLFAKMTEEQAKRWLKLL